MISSIIPDIASSKERALEMASMVQLQVPIAAEISDYGTKEPPPFSGNVDLWEFLANEKLIFAQIIGWTQEHVYHHMVQISLRPSAPFHNYEDRKIPKQAI